MDKTEDQRSFVDDDGVEKERDQIEDADSQYGTALYAADLFTKAVLRVPVLSKGSVNLKLMVEELVRLSLEVAGGDPVIFQADGERSTKQLLRAIQHCRAQLGLRTDIRTTGSGQHQSNGQAERTVQTVRRLANCLRHYAEEQAQITILGSSHLYPWSFRHASWLVNKYRVLEHERRTSHEICHGMMYKGKLCLFGESVMYKNMTAFKGEPLFAKGTWVGKSSWTDCIVLTPEGAVESRSVRRLPEQFSFDMLLGKGLPWWYSTGVLTKRVGRHRIPGEVEHAEEELQQLQQHEETLEEKRRSERIAREAGVAVALGLATPGLAGGATTPGLSGLVTPRVSKRKHEDEEKREASEAAMASSPVSTAPRVLRQMPPPPTAVIAGGPEKRENEAAEEAARRSKAVKISEEQTSASSSTRRRSAEAAQLQDESSPTKRAGIDEYDVSRVVVMPTGDEELALDEYLDGPMEGWMKERDDEDGGAEGKPPNISAEELEELDRQAEFEEIERLKKIPVIKELATEEENDCSEITTRMATIWKKRQEREGWFRRARLVARQFKWEC